MQIVQYFCLTAITIQVAETEAKKQIQSNKMPREDANGALMGINKNVNNVN